MSRSSIPLLVIPLVAIGPLRAQEVPARGEYVALVQDELLDAVGPLLDRKEAEGYVLRIVPLSSVPDAGRDRAESIREFLRSRYLDGRLRHLLLVGSYEAIPMRTANILPEDPARWEADPQDLEYSFDVPTDLYYGNLTGDWDADGDGRYGEYGDDRGGFDAQLLVGRIPFGDPDVVRAVAQRIVNYQTDRGAWKRRTLLAAGTIEIPGDSAVITETVRRRYFVPRGWACETFHAQGAPQGSDHVLDARTFRDALLEPAGLTFQIHHGSNLGAYHDASSLFLHANDAANLATDRGPVMVSMACTNGHPGGLAESFLRHHATAFIGASAVTSPFAGPGYLAEIHAGQQLAAGHTLGAAMRIVRNRYGAVALARDGGEWGTVYDVVRNLYAFIVYGDASTRVNQSEAPRARPSGARARGAVQNEKELHVEEALRELVQGEVLRDGAKGAEPDRQVRRAR